MRKSLAFVFSLVLVSVTTFACGSNDIGESCDEEGVASGQCVDGAVCAKNRSDQLVCLKQCSSQADCPSDTTCNGTKGSLKGCR